MDHLHVAQTIAGQIGRQTLFMIGAKNLLGWENGLGFKVGRNWKGVTHVKITLDSSDTYTVTFNKLRRYGLEITKVSESNGVYAEDLRKVIRNGTGMEVSLESVPV